MVKEEDNEERGEPSNSTQPPRKSGAPWEKQCTLCQKTFVSTSSANRHLRSIHGIDTSAGNAGYIIDKVSSSEEEAPSGDAPSLPFTSPAVDIENTPKDEPRVTQSKICELCHKSFSTGSTLNRHLRNVHGMNTSKQAEASSPLPSGTLDCALSSLIQSALPHPLEITVDSKEDIVLFEEVKEEELDESFPPQSIPPDLALDNDEAVSDNGSRDYDDCLEIRCDLCGKTFSQPSTLNRHLREIHKIATIRKEQPMKPTACPVCGEILRSQSLALRHRKEVHGSSTKIARLGTRCSIPGCKWTGHTHRDLVTHAQSNHSSASILFEWQSRTFETKEHFERWIEQRRKEGVEWYSRSSKTIDGVKQEYRYCLLEISGRGRKDERQRIHCTSYIKLLMHDDNSVSAEYCLDHLGHDGKNCTREAQQGLEKTQHSTESGHINGIGHSEDHGDEESLDLDDIPGPSVDSENSFVGASSLISGITSIHSDLTLKVLASSRTRLCRNCGKEFSCGSTLYRHLREVHKEDHPKSETVAIKTPCAVCGEIFPSGSQMRVHRSTAHPGSLGHRMNCPLEGCQWNGSTHRDLVKHARSLHSSPSSPFLWETRAFTDQKAFNEWLEELKKTGVHFYIRRSEKRRSLKVENRCCYFEENRARGISSPSRQRMKFSRKSVGSCTCYLTLTIREDGSIVTGFCLDHLGHTVDLDERPFREGRGGDEGEEEEEGEIDDTFDEVEEEGVEEEEGHIEKNQALEYLPPSGISPAHPGEEPSRSISVHDLHCFQESLARLSSGAARLQYSYEMDRLVDYLDKAFTTTRLLQEDGSKERSIKRRNGEFAKSDGKRVKREE
ncbi:hypothetical protein PMAYCL1PPCAC_24303 [Pristionchus mayeri]|uniref:C2H2-type domain-containing protein n=1 Tax=Pristionchus mayeri TaxID=1317129 RepID=A0AAN5CZW5_9BILA|nr:hypothetical protein PMAYCL1PPCAC_24303 [Pristionchus mayeri]